MVQQQSQLVKLGDPD